jgi:hypothetical protein
MTRTLTALAFAVVAASGPLYAGSSSAQMSVGVTVVRSCAIDIRPATTPTVHLTCTAGAGSNLKVSEIVRPPSAAIGSHGGTIVTLNF